MSPSDDRFERLIEEMLEGAAPARPPASLVDDAAREVDATHRRPRPWATLREPPMHYGSRVVVGSVYARRVAIMVSTLLLVLLTVGAGIAGASLLAGPAMIVVDQSGDGDFTTISEAVSMASDGDEILVRPGTYVEAVVIDKDVDISGAGPRESIIWRAPDDAPTRAVDVTGRRPYAVLMVDVDAMLSDLTFAGQAAALHIEGGAPTIQRLVLDGVGEPHTHSSGRYSFADAIAITGPSRAVVRGNILRASGPIAGHVGSEPLIEGNQLTAGPSILAYAPGDEMVIRDNDVSNSINRGIGVFGPNRSTIEGNTVTDAGGAGISVGRGSEPGNDSIVRRNTISRAAVGIEVATGAGPRIESNSVDGSGTGIGAGASTHGLVAIRNELRDNDRGISVVSSSARFEENVVEGGDIGALSAGTDSSTFLRNTIDGSMSSGFVIDERSTPVLTDNRICSLGDQVLVDREPSDEFDATNDICEPTQPTIVVDQAGDGDVTTITEAVAMAQDGDQILIRPGSNVEAVIVDKDIDLVGGGPRESIVWSAPESGPTGPNVTGQHQYALRLDHVSATLRGITLRGQGSAVHVAGGDATLAELTFDGVGEAHIIDLGRGTYADAVAVYDFGQATVVDSDLRGGGPIVAYEDSFSVIEGNTLNGGPSIHVFKPVEGSVVRGNRISGSRVRAIGVYGPSQLLIEDNVIDGSGADGIQVGIINDEDGNATIVRGNRVSGAFTAISSAENAAPTITDNMLTGNALGVWVSKGSDLLRIADSSLTDNGIGIRALGGEGTVEGNTVSGGEIGIELVWDADPTVTGNSVEQATVGPSIDSSSTGTVTDNAICHNATNLDVQPELEDDIRSTNEICEDAATG